MHHRITYMYINFQQNRVGKSVKTVHTNIFAKIAICINLQLPIVILKISIFSDMHHHTTYMYINFQQNRVCKSVKTVHTNIFAKNRNLHKFATTNSHFEKIYLQTDELVIQISKSNFFRTCITPMSIFRLYLRTICQADIV